MLISDHHFVHITQGHYFPQDVIVVACGDCDQDPHIHNFYQHHCQRCHSIRINGAAIRLTQESPAVSQELRQDRVLHHAILEAIQFKGISNVLISNPLPCGVAKAHSIHDERAVELQLQGAKELDAFLRSQGIHNVQILCDTMYFNGGVPLYSRIGEPSTEIRLIG